MALRPVVSFSRLVPRNGSTLEECEDRLALSPSRFAVADGASEAIYSDVWAEMLVTAFCAAAGCGDAVEAGGDPLPWLAESRSRWRAWTASLAVEALPWFAQEKLRAGSFATFAGLTFDSADAGGIGAPATLTWTASACGDACVFVVRGAELALAFPTPASDGFANSPPLLATSGGDADLLRVVCGRVEPGDRFYLATDALAQWLLAEHERGGRPWDAIGAIARPDVFDALVRDARRTGALRNDDLSFVAIAAGADG